MKTKLLIFLILIIGGFYSCKKCIDVEVPYTVEEPYEAIETINERLTYIIGENKYARVMGIPYVMSPKLESYTYVTNTSEKGGVFKLKQSFNSSVGETITLRDTKYISAGGTVKFEFSYELDDYVTIGSGEYDLTAPVVEMQKRVTKYRTVTKYRKCNTCVEDCGSMYDNDSEIPWWAYLIGGFVVLGIIGLVLEKLGVIDKMQNS